MCLDPVTLPTWLYTAGEAATATKAAVDATYLGMTAGGWATAASVGGMAMSGISGIQQSNYAKAQGKQADAEAAANATLIENEKEHNERLLGNKYEREQAARETYFGKYGGGESALEVLAGAAESYELDKGALETTAALNKAGVYYTADAKKQQAMQRANQAMGSSFDSLLSGGARTYRVYKGAA